MKRTKKCALTALTLTAALVTSSALAVRAQTGLLIFNSSTDIYTTTNPTACAGVTFPTPISTTSPQQGAVIQVDPLAPTTSFPCTTVYTDPSGNYTCTITIRVDSTVGYKVYASDNLGGEICQVGNNNSIVNI